PERLFLRLEAVEDRAFGDARPRRDLERRRADAVLEEHLASDLEQALVRNHRRPPARACFSVGRGAGQAPSARPGTGGTCHRQLLSWDSYSERHDGRKREAREPCGVTPSTSAPPGPGAGRARRAHTAVLPRRARIDPALACPRDTPTRPEPDGPRRWTGEKHGERRPPAPRRQNGESRISSESVFGASWGLGAGFGGGVVSSRASDFSSSSSARASPGEVSVGRMPTRCVFGVALAEGAGRGALRRGVAALAAGFAFPFITRALDDLASRFPSALGRPASST